MAVISFPTSELTRPRPGECDIGIRNNVQIMVSDLSGYVQTRELPGARWTMSFRLPNRELDDAAVLRAWLLQLRGGANRGRVPVFGNTKRIRGTWSSATPRVNNEVGSPTLSQTGSTLYIRNLTSGMTIKKGDSFNIGTGGQFVSACENATADVSGLATLSVEPGVRVAPAHNTDLILTGQVIPLMILTNPHNLWTERPGGFTDFAFDLVEVFA